MGLGVLVGALTFLGVSIAQGDSLVAHYVPPRFPPEHAPQLPDDPCTTPECLYVQTCGGCHQSNGKGLTGVFPPVVNSRWTAGDPDTLIRIAVLGVSGPIVVGGETWDSTMPPPVVENDEDLARLLTFVRGSFAEGSSQITAEQIRAVREDLGDRTELWKAEELLELQVR